jgi:hypothetical protein
MYRSFQAATWLTYAHTGTRIRIKRVSGESWLNAPFGEQGLLSIVDVMTGESEESILGTYKEVINRRDPALECRSQSEHILAGQTKILS